GEQASIDKETEEANSKSPASHSRRKFLGEVSGITAVTIAAGAIGLEPLLGSNSGVAKAEDVLLDDDFSTGPLSRIERARKIRVDAANAERALGVFPHPRNLDEERYPTRIANFTKTLPHNNLGEVDQAAYNALLQALRTRRFDDFEHIPQGGRLGF